MECRYVFDVPAGHDEAAEGDKCPGAEERTSLGSR